MKPKRPVWPIRIAAIDPSLTGSAVALGMPDGVLQMLTTWTSKPSGMLVAKRDARYQRLCDSVVAACSNARLVLIEGYAYSSKGKHLDLAEYGGRLRHELLIAQPGRTIVEITPGTLKKFATGKGNANKDQMVAAVVRRWDQDEVVDTNDKADAVALFYLGCAALGCEYGLGKKKLEAVAEAKRTIDVARVG